MDTAAIKTALLERRADILTRIESIEQDLKKTHSQDFAEQVTERENEEVLEGLLRDARQEQQDIRTALLRIEAGSYGICSRCGETINAKRLLARPAASKCINCAA